MVKRGEKTTFLEIRQRPTLPPASLFWLNKILMTDNLYVCLGNIEDGFDWAPLGVPAGEVAAHTHPESEVTSLSTDLAGKQSADSDLTTIAALVANDDDIIQRKAGAWTNRSMAQTKTDLSLVKGDVGLGNVDNTSDANKPVSSATSTALGLKQPLDSDLTTIAGLTPTTDNFLVAVASAWASRTPAQVKVTLAIAESDVTNLTTDLSNKQPLDSDLTTIAGLIPTTDNFMVAAASAWASRTPAQAKTSLSLSKTDVGLANVDNTSDANKPVSTAQQTALDAKAPVGSKYIVQQADATLSAEQSLGALATGILKNTTTSGVLSIALAGTDYPAVGAALTEVAEAASTPVAGATSTALGTGVRVFAFFTLPTTEKWYIITGIEWLNKATVNGNVWCGAEAVDANPPVIAGTVNVAVGAPVAQAGANGAQRNSQIASKAIRGGTIIGVWFVSDSATGTFGNTAVSSANNRKTLAAGAPATADNTAWTASTAGYYVKAYYRGIA